MGGASKGEGPQAANRRVVTYTIAGRRAKAPPTFRFQRSKSNSVWNLELGIWPSVLSRKFAVLIRDGFSSSVRRATQECRESFEERNKAVGEKTPEVAA